MRSCLSAVASVLKSSTLALALALVLPNVRALCAADHILTIGGGYAPEGNQASLEANVIFFQKVAAQTHPAGVNHRIHFADGFDPGEDLQVLHKPTDSDSPAITLLEEIFSSPGSTGGEIIYRNHQVPAVSGSNRLGDVRKGFDVVKGQLHDGDRLIVYVTAHGGSAKGHEPYDTSITCWGHRELTMHEFSRWLDTLPKSVPVILVMAQCYCGGFAHTMFLEGDREEGLAANVRTGFFAQRHDLPAAGCRPDVDDDEEYSSYFWGALVGYSRSGKAVAGADCDGDGRVSLAEAHAHAVVASETIDIPLCGSDALLREASRIPKYDFGPTEADDRRAEGRASDSTEEPDSQSASDTHDSEQLAYMSGTLGELAQQASPTQRHIITALCDQLSIKQDQDVGVVFKEYDQAQRDYRNARRGSGGRRGRGGFGRRRELRAAILDRWPELDDPAAWTTSPTLAGDSGDTFLAEIKAMPGYEAFARSRDERQAARRRVFTAEMREVRLQRLIHTLESVILAHNLRAIAAPDMIERYEAMLKLEQSFFGS